MSKVKEVYFSLGKANGFNIHVEVIGVSRDGSKVIVRPVAGSGSFEVERNQIRNSFK